MGHSRPLFRLNVVSSNFSTIFAQQINVKKDTSSMWQWDSNSQPLRHKSPPFTTRPGLQHDVAFLILCVHQRMKNLSLSLPMGLSGILPYLDVWHFCK